MADQEIRVSLCPLCAKPRVLEYRPFCSKHCADLDLSRWFNGVYAAPAAPEDEEDGFDPDVGAGTPGSTNPSDLI